MRRLQIILLVLVWAVSCFAQESDSVFVERLLHEAETASTEWFARQFLGRPYVAHTLEVNDMEQLVVNTRELDCTTLVENVLALTLCKQHGQTTFAAFRNHLQQLRYRQGIIDGYPSRLHYFTDWINDNVSMGLVSDVQRSEAPFTSVQNIRANYMSTHPNAYKALKAHPEFVEIIARQEQLLTGRKYRYIPKSQIKNTQMLRQTIKTGDVIAITCSKPGLEIAHLGFAVWQRDGLHLLNASQIHKKVVLEPMTLRDYLYRHSSHTGIRVIRLNR